MFTILTSAKILYFYIPNMTISSTKNPSPKRPFLNFGHNNLFAGETVHIIKCIVVEPEPQGAITLAGAGASILKFRLRVRLK
jgi:hypothetical protein